MTKSLPTMLDTAGHELLTPAQMYATDAAAIAAGTPGIELMENAGRAIFREIVLRWSRRPVLVLAGPGNNGGDGFVVARLLLEDGWPVRLVLAGDAARLKGDAALAFESWAGDTEPATPDCLGDARLVVDALFGAGLARDIDGDVAALVTAVNESGLPVVAVDIPSGVDGETGQVRGVAIAAQLTVTFCRRKPGHLLLPGRDLAGETVCDPIGIGFLTISADSRTICENSPALWRRFLPSFSVDSHKYTRGAVLVVSGPAHHTGAARLAAAAALRSGAGLVTVAAPGNSLAENAAHLTAIMLTRLDNPQALYRIVKSRKIGSIAIGPGCGVGDATRNLVRAALDTGCPVVLDADALTSFTDAPAELFSAIAEHPDRAVVLTPHEGEFSRLFKQLPKTHESKWQRAKTAADHSGAVILLKGADTVIAAPGAQTVVVNANAPAHLATAGAGDVLTGITATFLAQGTPPLAAAAAAVWLHGKAASLAGPGMTADDLPGLAAQAMRQHA